MKRPTSQYLGVVLATPLESVRKVLSLVGRGFRRDIDAWQAMGLQPLRACLLLLCLSALVGTAISYAQIPSGKDVLAPTAYVSYDPVARGMAFQVAVVLKIRPGFHINARQVTEDYLIPTDLKADVPAGFKVSEVIYPKGTLETFTFAKNKPLNVYTDTVTVRLPLTALPNAPVGAQHLPMKLRYQACSSEICLPPVTKDVDTTVNVVAAQSAAKPANAAIFAK